MLSSYSPFRFLKDLRDTYRQDLQEHEARLSIPTVRTVEEVPPEVSPGESSKYELYARGSQLVPPSSTVTLLDDITNTSWRSCAVYVQTGAHATANINVDWEIVDTSEIESALFDRGISLAPTNLFAVFFNPEFPLIPNSLYPFRLRCTNNEAAVAVQVTWEIYFYDQLK